MSPSRKNHENVSGPGNQSPRTKVADQTPFLSSSKSSDAATPTCRSILRKRIRVNRHAVGNDYQTATGMNMAEGVKANPRIDSLCDPHAHPEMQPNPLTRQGPRHKRQNPMVVIKTGKAKTKKKKERKEVVELRKRPQTSHNVKKHNQKRKKFNAPICKPPP